jgi:prohibitin 1
MAATSSVLNTIARGAIGIGAGVSLFQSSIYNVDGGFRAVMFDRLRGVQSGVRGEGTHFRIPWLQTPHIFDVRIRPRNISSATGTKDL